MKIVRIELFGVDVGFGDTAYATVGSAAKSSLEGTLVRIDTDEGVCGWGEVTPWGRAYLPEFTEAARAGLNVICPTLIGVDATDLAAVHRWMDASIDGHAYIKSAVDIACWDILGKRAGLPIHRLLGGAGSTEIPMNCAVYNGPVGEMSDRIERYRSEGGYRIFSTKPSGEAARDIALYRKLAAIRRDDETFIADANRLWSITDALRVVRSAADQGFNIEQPCGTYEQCLRVRRASGATFTLDESVTNGDVLARAFRDNAADIIHVKLGRIGGLSAARDFIGFCRTAGLSLSWASSGGTEIAYMASLHAAAATDADHLFGLWDCTEFNVREYAAGACKIEDGVARPSAQPGLGIEIDPEMIGQTLGHFP